MKTNKKTALEKLILYLSCIVLMCYLYIYDANTVSGSPATGIRLFVNNDGKAIEGATVFVPELNEYFKTGKDGYTSPIFINDNVKADSQCLKTITLLIYADGYIDTIYYYVQMFEGVLRDNISIKLYTKSGDDYLPFFTFTETPPNQHSQQLIDRYKR